MYEMNIWLYKLDTYMIIIILMMCIVCYTCVNICKQCIWYNAGSINLLRGPTRLNLLRGPTRLKGPFRFALCASLRFDPYSAIYYKRTILFICRLTLCSTLLQSVTLLYCTFIFFTWIKLYKVTLESFYVHFIWNIFNNNSSAIFHHNKFW